MNIHKVRKVLFVTSIVLIAVQLLWFPIVQIIVNKTQTRTTATVIRIDRKAAGCTGDRPGKPDPTCDHSDRLYPVYEYYDQLGVRYVQDDKYFGEIKENNPLRRFFSIELGDTTTAYYTNDKPEEVLFMATPLSYTAWLVPLYLLLPVIVTLIPISLYIKLKK